MAILQGFPGLKVEVWSGGGVLQEYDIEAEEADERNTVTKYIQATSNQKFQLHWLIHPTFKYAKNDISTHVYIDGEDVDNRIFSQAKLKKTVNYTNNGAERYEKGEWVLRKYKFSALETSA